MQKQNKINILRRKSVKNQRRNEINIFSGFSRIDVGMLGRSTHAICDLNGKAQDAKEGEIPYIVQIRILHPHTGRFPE